MTVDNFISFDRFPDVRVKSPLEQMGAMLVIRFMWLAAIGLIVAFHTGTAFAGPADGAVLCSNSEDWTRRAGIESYFRSPYYEVDLHSGAHLWGAHHDTGLANKSQDEQVRIFTNKHNSALGIILRIGHLLPRLSGPADLAALAHEFDSGEILAPISDTFAEFLRVALARDMLASSHDAGAKIASFLHDMNDVAEITAKLMAGNATQAQVDDLIAATNHAYASRKPFMIIAKKVIFAPELHDRMSARLMDHCAATLPHEAR